MFVPGTVKKKDCFKRLTITRNTLNHYSNRAQIHLNKWLNKNFKQVNKNIDANFSEITLIEVSSVAGGEQSTFPEEGT